jgi:hypothetical protein
MQQYPTKVYNLYRNTMELTTEFHTFFGRSTLWFNDSNNFFTDG